MVECQQSRPLRCAFCGGEIKDGDEWFNWWAIDEQKFYKICLKCMRSIDGLCPSAEEVKNL